MTTLTVMKETDSVREINPEILRSLSLKTENNLADFVVVVTDALVKTSKDCQSLLDYLRSMIKDPVHDFDALDSSLSFIEANREATIFLISSGSFGKLHGDQIFKIPQIVCNYIFCFDCTKYESWAQTIPKYRGIFTDKAQLLETVSKDIKHFACRWSFLDERSFQKASSNDAQWYQLFIRVLIHQPRTENTWPEMLHECRSFYQKQVGMLKKIDDFEKNYTSGRAIEYYCDDSFVYRIINYALRTHDIDIILKFQPYISDLYNAIQEKSIRQNRDYFMKRDVSPIRVAYRGQYMPEAELQQLKEFCRSRNSRVALNTFGSATRDPAIALRFIPDDRPGFARCLYQIVIPDSFYTARELRFIFCHQFADISDTTNMPDEQEVLFNIGSLFRIRYIGQSTLKCPWVLIVLELHADGQGFDILWNKLSVRIRNESDAMKKELLQFVRDYQMKGDELDWNQWWQKLKRTCEPQKRNDESLITIMHEGFSDRQSIDKAIELHKQLLIVHHSSIFQTREKIFRVHSK